MGANKSRATTTQETIDRELRCLELRRRGLTYAEIAADSQVGYSTAKSAQRSVERALRRTLQPAANAARVEWRDRLESLWGVSYDIARDGKAPFEARLSAVRTCVRVAERAARLDGLDAPVRHDVTVTDSITAEIMALADELERQAQVTG